MAYNKTDYIKQQITGYLQDFIDGKITQDDINWGELYIEVRRCQELGIMNATIL